MNENIAHVDTGYDTKATKTTRRCYQRNARFYDLMKGGAEKQHEPCRKQLWSLTKGSKVLEVSLVDG